MVIYTGTLYIYNMKEIHYSWVGTANWVNQNNIHVIRLIEPF